MNTPLFIDRFLASGVGSLPSVNPKEACSLIFKYLKDGIPFWPQLPRRDFKENMYVQYSEGLPGVVIDEKQRKIHINTKAPDYDQDIEKVGSYVISSGQVGSSSLDYFKISPEFAAGFYEFINQRDYAHDKVRYVKGQIIGPISFGLTVCDEDKKAVIYNEEFRNWLLIVLVQKAIWQIKELKKAYPKAEVVIFVDEPYLVSLGSSYFNIPQKEVARMLNQVIDSIRENGAYVGLHCCGNTDWPVLLKTNIDILSFDAHDYLDKLLLYKDDLENFLNRGGILAYGIVPTGEENELPNEESLIKKLGAVRKNSLITPACGLSGISLKKADEILNLTLKIAEGLSTK